MDSKDGVQILKVGIVLYVVIQEVGTNIIIVVTKENTYPFRNKGLRIDDMVVVIINVNLHNIEEDENYFESTSDVKVQVVANGIKNLNCRNVHMNVDIVQAVEANHVLILVDNLQGIFKGNVNKGLDSVVVPVVFLLIYI